MPAAQQQFGVRGSISVTARTRTRAAQREHCPAQKPVADFANTIMNIRFNKYYLLKNKSVIISLFCY
jgi:hypothetical protein